MKEPRPPFTDGFNSGAHVALGYMFEDRLLLPFLAYQFLLKPDHNSGVDTAEYLAGWALRLLRERQWQQRQPVCDVVPSIQGK